MSDGTIRKGQQYRPDVDVTIPYLQHMGDLASVDANYGHAGTDIQPNDRQSAVIKVVDRDAVRALLFGFFIVQPTTVTLQLPPILTGFTVTVEKNHANGSSFLDGTGAAVGTSVSLSLPIKSDATSSATILPDVTPNIYEPFTQDLPARQVLLYSDDTIDITPLLVRLTAGLATPATVTVSIASPGVVTYNTNPFVNGDIVMLRTTGALPTGLAANTFYYVVSHATNSFRLSLTEGGAAINTSGSQSGVHSVYAAVRPWPIFKPDSVTLVVTGQAVSLSANAQVQQQVFISHTDVSQTTGFGTGTSKQVSSTIKTVRVPPTLHAALVLEFSPGVYTETETATVQAHAHMAAGANWLTLDEDTGAITQNATATLAPNAWTATSPPAYPTHGLYLQKIDSLSFEYGTTRIMATIFDFGIFQ